MRFHNHVCRLCSYTSIYYVCIIRVYNMRHLSQVFKCANMLVIKMLNEYNIKFKTYEIVVVVVFIFLWVLCFVWLISSLAHCYYIIITNIAIREHVLYLFIMLLISNCVVPLIIHISGFKS